jgi:uncharacterized protein YyaL (SSP411 family)
MKQFILFISLVALTHGAFAQKPTVKWMTWDEAIAANQKAPKKIFIDVYTDWCGWCKVMDSKTFSDSSVAAYMNANFYCVKFNAEQKEDIKYKDATFKYKAEKKAHELALSLLNGEMMYPSYVFLTETEKRITIVKGYYEVDPFLKNLKTINEFKEK